MTDTLWILIGVQMLLGAFDTFFHHEGTERLAWRPTQRTELRLHGVRNLAYALLFLLLGWAEPRGAFALALLALVVAELGITLWDFVEEDRTRQLPASERIAHTLLTLNYGAILALLIPWLRQLARLETALVPAHHGVMSWLCAVAALGVLLSGLRDLAAARRAIRLTQPEPASLAAALPSPKRVLVTGGTGFVGSRLVDALAAAGHDVLVLTRNRSHALPLASLGPVRILTSLDTLPGDSRIDAIVNLAGEPISDSPWTAAKRRRILQSRLRVTRDVTRLIARLQHKPLVLVSGSAVGWYGLRGDKPLIEADVGTPCFSRRVCVAWERAARHAERHGVRTVRLRIGLVLDRSGGMLARLLTPFEFGLGGRFGDGSHWMSWIHRDDLVRLIVHAIAHPRLEGAVNAVAPEPVTNRRFTATLATALHRPARIPIPAWPLRLLLGDFAEELLLNGQRVLPDTAMRSGFIFDHATLASALAQITGAGGQRRPQEDGRGTDRPGLAPRKEQVGA
jgi:uncharacterized protein (TIGR01777 family)